jgi:hypothetical protein
MASTHDAASPLWLRRTMQLLRYGFEARCEKDRSEKAAPVKIYEAKKVYGSLVTDSLTVPHKYAQQ